MSEGMPKPKVETAKAEVAIESPEEKHTRQLGLLIDPQWIGYSVPEVQKEEPAAQERLAEDYFNIKMAENPSPAKAQEAYELYGKMKGTSFGDKFLELENARREAEGAEPLGL
jgi:hypothetical protein